MRPLRPATAATRRRGDAGSVSLELVVVFPAVLALVFGIVQAGLYYSARSVAATAAQEGARAASLETGTAADGRDAALAFAARAGSGLLLESAANSSRAPTQVTVVVTGSAMSVLPGVGGPPIRQSASLPAERITR
ncbi:MAG: TadE family protein [Kineosporiaceae bacterium]